MKSRKQGLEVSCSPGGAVPDSQWVLLRTRARCSTWDAKDWHAIPGTYARDAKSEHAVPGY